MQSLSKLNTILFFILLVFVLLYFGAPFLIPFVFGLLFASLVTPLAGRMESIGISRVFSSIICTLLVFVVAGTLLFLFVYQVDKFISDFPSFRKEMQQLVEDIQYHIASLTNLSLEDQSIIWQDKSGELINRVEPQITRFVGGIISSLFSFLMMLIYTLLLLLYRDKLYVFVLKYIPDNNMDSWKETLSKINKVVFHYLWGRIKVMMLLGVMFYITFLIFGLPYALLLTIFGSLITIIPYFGPFISGLMPIVFSFVFFDSIQKALLFTVIIITIQLLESYLLEPLIIGKEVKLNPLVVIIAVVVGGLVWGMAGMIVFVPLFAMFKIISLSTPGLEPIGSLFGNATEKNK